MGRRGPAPKPTWLKVLEGNPGKRALRKPRGRQKAEPEELSCPDWLDQEVRAHWKRLSPEMQRMGLLTLLDSSLFAIYCQTYADWVAVEKRLAETGLTYVTPAGQVRVRPELSIANQYMRSLLEFARDFGMTPASRARMSLPISRDEASDVDSWMVDG